MNSNYWKLTVLAAAMVLTAGVPETTLAGGKVAIPFDPANFPNPTIINNPLWPLIQGTAFTYVAETGDGECEVNTVQVLNRTTQPFGSFNPKTIATLNVITVYDVGWVTDCENILEPPDFEVLEEVTFDWYAQDGPGNIWYLGEATYDCDGGDCVLGDGAWQTGFQGAIPGIIMLANPRPGNQYDQEVAENALDKAKVLRVNAWVSLYRDDAFPPGDFHGCVKTKEWTPLERGTIEHKWNCPSNNDGFAGGLVAVDELKGKTVRFELINQVVPAPLPADPNDLPPFPN